MLGSVTFLVIKANVSFVYAIINLKVSASSSADALNSIYLLRVAFNSKASFFNPFPPLMR